MSFHQSSRYCDVCDRQTLSTAPTVNHMYHALATFCTCGLWLFPWVLVTIWNSWFPSWRCSKCGTRV